MTPYDQEMFKKAGNMGLKEDIKQKQIEIGEQAIISNLRKKGILPLYEWENEAEEQTQKQIADFEKDVPEENVIDILIKQGKLLKEAGLDEEEKLKVLKSLGNRFNQGKLQWHLVDFKALEPMVKVLMYGAKKYAPDQWKNGLSKKDTLDSLLRHVHAILAGEMNDVEFGESHIGHILCNAMFYSYFEGVDPSNARP